MTCVSCSKTGLEKPHRALQLSVFRKTSREGKLTGEQKYLNGSAKCLAWPQDTGKGKIREVLARQGSRARG